MNTIASANHKDRVVATWLLCVCALVFCMVVLGGATRLTGSGLSMVDWRPVVGWLPPISDSDWQRSFELYQQSPQFQKVNSHMGLGDYKEIFWLEYLHRLLGRIIGIAFFVPFVILAASGYIRRNHWPRYLLMLMLGGLQGVLGWYMVKSGLIDNPQVSQYRLTAHLVAAFLIYGYMLWIALSLLYPSGEGSRHHVLYRRTQALTALIAFTIISGGFVAGLKAGKIYNTFPLMGDSLLPPGLLAMDPGWRNAFENATTAQFDHRLLAISTFLLIVAYWFTARRRELPSRVKKAVNALLHTSALQVALGIATLLLAVPIVLGVLHQATALLLFTVAIYLTHSLRKVPMS